MEVVVLEELNLSKKLFALSHSDSSKSSAKEKLDKGLLLLAVAEGLAVLFSHSSASSRLNSLSRASSGAECVVVDGAFWTWLVFIAVVAAGAEVEVGAAGFASGTETCAGA